MSRKSTAVGSDECRSCSRSTEMNVNQKWRVTVYRGPEPNTKHLSRCCIVSYRSIWHRKMNLWAQAEKCLTSAAEQNPLSSTFLFPQGLKWKDKRLTSAATTRPQRVLLPCSHRMWRLKEDTWFFHFLILNSSCFSPPQQNPPNKRNRRSRSSHRRTVFEIQPFMLTLDNITDEGSLKFFV